MKPCRLETNIYRGLRRASFYTKHRPLIETVFENLCSGLNVVQLPTGYGKTALPVVSGLSTLVSPENYVRAIHVLPLRSIIDDAYNSTSNGLKKLGFQNVEEFVARQMMGVPGSPFLNKNIVFVTVETFKLHMLKTPPPEIKNIICPKLLGGKQWETFGHFEISRGAIIESAVFIDEPQLMTAEHNMQDFLASLIYALAALNTPTVLMTATISKGLRKTVKEAAEKFCSEYREMLYGENIFDKDFENNMKSKKVETRLANAQAADIVKDLQKENRWNRVLIVVNTVDKAKKLYSMFGGEEPLILHGRLTKQDREKALDTLKNRSSWLAITTQVVEAGVNISAQQMLTEIAPASSLVQRAGRVARYDEETEGEIIIAEAEPSPYSQETVEKTYEILRKIVDGGTIFWRLPKAENGVGYSCLIDLVHNDEVYFPPNNILNQMLNPLSTPDNALFAFAENNMINVYVSDDYYVISEEKSYVSDLTKFAQHHRNAPAVIQDESGIRVQQDLTVKQIIRKQLPLLFMVCNGIIGFVVSEEDYRNEAFGVVS
ncbi:MAG: CRISPR-associated helicase Cas3' [Candidatus Caldarchaeum sp.]|nr:CRISPR-associated helicase Cas3' [Candidatus Caldarchaeum sp.]